MQCKGISISKDTAAELIARIFGTLKFLPRAGGDDMYRPGETYVTVSSIEELKGFAEYFNANASLYTVFEGSDSQQDLVAAYRQVVYQLQEIPEGSLRNLAFHQGTGTLSLMLGLLIPLSNNSAVEERRQYIYLY